MCVFDVVCVNRIKSEKIKKFHVLRVSLSDTYTDGRTDGRAFRQSESFHLVSLCVLRVGLRKSKYEMLNVDSRIWNILFKSGLPNQFWLKTFQEKGVQRHITFYFIGQFYCPIKSIS